MWHNLCPVLALQLSGKHFPSRLFLSRGCVWGKGSSSCTIVSLELNQKMELFFAPNSSLTLKCHIHKNNRSRIPNSCLPGHRFLTKLHPAAFHSILPQAKTFYVVMKYTAYWYRFYFLLIFLFLDEILMQFSSLVSESI